MASDATILVIGTFDTKSDELAYLREQIESQGASAICMDVSVLGDAAIPVEIDKHDVASAAGSSIAEAAAAGDENSAMQIMARGASSLSSQLHAQGRIDAMVVDVEKAPVTAGLSNFLGDGDACLWILTEQTGQVDQGQMAGGSVAWDEAVRHVNSPAYGRAVTLCAAVSGASAVRKRREYRACRCRFGIGACCLFIGPGVL